jgi:hypothetical protein
VSTIVVTNAGGSIELCEFVTETPYARYREGWRESDGRSLAGKIRVKGGNYPAKLRWDLAFKVSRAELSVFEAIVANQIAGAAVLVDNFESPPTSNFVWIDLDDRYATRIAEDWWLVQFSAREV